MDRRGSLSSLVSVLLDLFYLVAAVVASPWIAYRLISRGDWRGLAERFGSGLGAQLRGSIWLHGSSAGEVALLAPLVRLLENSQIENPLVISAYSATGIAAARRSFPGHRVVVFPFDLSFIVRRAFRCLDPRLVVIVESEYWPNFLRAAHARGIPVAVVNAKMSERSRRFYARTRLVPALLRELDLFAVQSSTHADRIRALGVPPARVLVTGNMKYDLAHGPSNGHRSRSVREQLGFDPDDVVIIGGSVHDREDAVLLEAYQTLRTGRDRVRLVIVPRYPRDAGHVAQLVRNAGFAAVRKTEIDRSELAPPGISGVLIVDTVGELRELYGIADIAFVGGSLFYRGSNKGGHNLMEPAVCGIPVVFGPHNYSFRDTAQQLVDAQAGFEVGDGNALTQVLGSLVDDEALRHASGRRAAQVIVAGQGATRRNFELLMPLIRAADPRLPAPGLGPTMPPALSDVE